VLATCPLGVREHNYENAILPKQNWMWDMSVLLTLLVTHGAVTVTGMMLVGDEGGYKGRELLRSFFFFITHSFRRFTKTTCAVLHE
jgi:hypothetical protein